MAIRKTLQGSTRKYNPGRKMKSIPHDQENLILNIFLHDDKPVSADNNLSKSEWLDSYSPSEEAVELVKKFALDYNLEIQQINLTERKMTLSGSINAMQKALGGIEIGYYEHANGNYISHEEEISLPSELAKHVLGITGLHHRRIIKPQSSLPDLKCDTKLPPGYPGQGSSGYPPYYGKLYDFPTDLDGSGQTIALIELGGGYKMEDLVTYFNSQDLKIPKIVDVPVNGGTNKPGINPYEITTMEVYLDISVAGSLSNGAKLAVYFTPKDTIDQLIDAISQAVFDKVNQPDIISLSWVWIEKEWSQLEIQVVERVLKNASDLGITVTVASGDFGSLFEIPGTQNPDQETVHVAYPTSSPNVIGCGATCTIVNDKEEIIYEVVWSTPPGAFNPANPNGATGGGISTVFDLPPWQKNADVPPMTGPNPAHSGRCIPDMAASVGFYWTYVLGKGICQGGTSAVAPLMASLIALANQKAGTNVGYVNPALYEFQIVQGKEIFTTIKQGSNGAYSASKLTNYNACTGLGTPNGKALVDNLVEYAKSKKIKTA